MAIGKTKLDELINRRLLLSSDEAWLTFFTSKKRDEIADMVRERLKTKGTDKNDDIIGFYSLVTEFISNGKKKFNTHYTLFDTGEFHRSIHVMVFIREIVINANAQKGEDNLFEKFGTGIIGLTDEQINTLVFQLKKHYQRYIRETLKIT